MNRQEFEEYKFSSGSENADVFDRYYDPDAVFEHPLEGTFKGKKGIVEFRTAAQRHRRGAQTTEREAQEKRIFIDAGTLI